MPSHRDWKVRPRLVAVLAYGALALRDGPAGAVQFVDVASEVGLVYQHAAAPVTEVQPPAAASQPTGGGAAGDVDGDGWVDLVVSRLDAPPILFRNLGGTFADATASAGDLAASLPAGSNGVGCADLDNDGDVDLYVTSHGTTRFYLFVNDGSGTFVEDAVARGAALADGNPHYGMGVAVGDYDRDGWLDLLVTEWWAHPTPPAPPLPGTSHNRLLRNLGHGAPAHFTDVTIAAGIDFESPPDVPTTALGTPGFSPGFVDFDGDGWPDVTWVADWGHSRLFWNGADGTFADGTVAAGVGRERSGMGSTQDDFDGDGSIDWLTTSIFGRPDEIPFGVSNQLYRNLGDRSFDNVTQAAGVADGGFGWAASSFDFDNDGDVDVVHTNGLIVPGHPEELRWRTDRTRLFENDGDGSFDEIGAARGIIDAEHGKGLLTFDFDRDGDLDVFVANHAGAPVLYRNDGGNARSWLQLELEGALSNRDGIGAVVTVTPDFDEPAREQTRHHLANANFLGHDERLLHFGLDDRTAPVDRVIVRWPSGIEQTLADVPVKMHARPGRRGGVGGAVPFCGAFDRRAAAARRRVRQAPLDLPGGRGTGGRRLRRPRGIDRLRARRERSARRPGAARGSGRRTLARDSQRTSLRGSHRRLGNRQDRSAATRRQGLDRDRRQGLGARSRPPRAASPAPCPAHERRRRVLAGDLCRGPRARSRLPRALALG